MIAYDELVGALAAWRARQGMAETGADYLGAPKPFPIYRVAAPATERRYDDGADDYVRADDGERVGDDDRIDEGEYTADGYSDESYGDAADRAVTAFSDDAGLASDDYAGAETAIAAESFATAEGPVEYAASDAPTREADSDYPANYDGDGYDDVEGPPTQFGSAVDMDGMDDLDDGGQPASEIETRPIEAIDEDDIAVEETVEAASIREETVLGIGVEIPPGPGDDDDLIDGADLEDPGPDDDDRV